MNAASRLLLGKAAIAAVAFALSGGAAVAAEPGHDAWLEARRAIDEQRDADARPLLLQAAQAGHVRAATALGLLALYEPGWSGDEPRADFARTWLTRAAIGGSEEARHVLASMNGTPVRVARRAGPR